MVVCVIALIVFAVLGIFSATHRLLALEAFDCVFRKITLRKCHSKLDIRIKSHITGKLMKTSPTLARVVYKYFEVLSWIFTITFILSIVYVAIGGYNYYLYGNCNGLTEEGFCIFDPLGENLKFSTIEDPEICSIEPPNPKYLTLANVDLSIFPAYDRNQENDIIFIGCYACPYTRDAYPNIRKLLDRDDVNFIFAHLPAKEGTYYLSNILSCIYQTDKQKFIKFNDELFGQDIDLRDKEVIFDIVEDIGVDRDIISECSDYNETTELTDKQIEEMKKIGVYGTPTVFINGNALVGPKPYRVYKRLLK